ncbi:MAG TPA: hypothetical protein VF710_21425, partial [Longimicrobium sp.]
MKLVMTMAAVAALAIPAALAAQVETKATVGARVGVDAPAAQTGLSADATVRATADAGLPDAPVRRAVARSRSRGNSEAETARIAAEVQARLIASRDALSNDGRRVATNAEITAGADAMAKGATRAELSLLARSAPPRRSLVASVDALARLGTGSGDFARSATTIAGRLRAGASDPSITRLGVGAQAG